MSTSTFGHDQTSSGKQSLCQLVHFRLKLTGLTFCKDKVLHRVELCIDTASTLRSSAQHLSPNKLAVAKAAFKEVEDFGIIRRSSSQSSSQSASPLHITPKPGGGWCPCGDFRRLKCHIKADCYPHPRLCQSTFGQDNFLKDQLVKSYHQIPVHAMGIPKRAVITTFSLYEFLHTPFGLANTAQAYQRLMDLVLGGLDCIFIYLDDILVASFSPNQHLRDLTAIFDHFE